MAHLRQFLEHHTSEAAEDGTEADPSYGDEEEEDVEDASSASASPVDIHARIEQVRAKFDEALAPSAVVDSPVPSDIGTAGDDQVDQNTVEEYEDSAETDDTAAESEPAQGDDAAPANPVEGGVDAEYAEDISDVEPVATPDET